MKHNALEEHNENEIKAVLDQDSLENEVSSKILDSAFKIHRLYGPGLLESAYEHLLCYELTQVQGLKTERQKILPIKHETVLIDAGYRLDLVVENCVIVELKCVEKILPIHQAQLMTYLQLSEIRLGLIVNFNTRMLKEGIKRMVV
ncbi:MAG: GxxExxY protein [Alphaproteobacteria bacterium]|nr:GxxExxY protein [Alphaproteobacteria bacterium]QQS58434.1 MAG: GxxExxY protein [Alphaproteobacteria bacterium]